MKEPLISIITPVKNCSQFIGDAIISVKEQSYKNIEHIVIDGGSTDGTVEIVKKLGVSLLISEKDNGQYDGMNKGIRLSKGEIIGFLNGDDFYADCDVLKDVVSALKKNYDSCYGDLVYVRRDNPDIVVRYWKAGEYKKGRFKRGWMIPHPTFFVKKNIFERFGFFNTRLKISSDYELMLRFVERYNISTYYINRVLVKMRCGGKSNNIKNLFKKNFEDYLSWRLNKMSISPFLILYKPLSKLNQFFIKI